MFFYVYKKIENKKKYKYKMSELAQNEIKNKDEVYTDYLLYTALQMINSIDDDSEYGFLKCNYSGILRNAYEKNLKNIVHTQKYCGKTLKEYINIEFEKINDEGLTIVEFLFAYTDRNAYGGNDAMDMYLLHYSNIGYLYNLCDVF